MREDYEEIAAIRQTPSREEGRDLPPPPPDGDAGAGRGRVVVGRSSRLANNNNNNNMPPPPPPPPISAGIGKEGQGATMLLSPEDEDDDDQEDEILLLGRHSRARVEEHMRLSKSIVRSAELELESEQELYHHPHPHPRDGHKKKKDPPPPPPAAARNHDTDESLMKAQDEEDAPSIGGASSQSSSHREFYERHYREHQRHHRSSHQSQSQSRSSRVLQEQQQQKKKHDRRQHRSKSRDTYGEEELVDVTEFARRSKIKSKSRHHKHPSRHDEFHASDDAAAKDGGGAKLTSSAPPAAATLTAPTNPSPSPEDNYAAAISQYRRDRLALEAGISWLKTEMSSRKSSSDDVKAVRRQLKGARAALVQLTDERDGMEKRHRREVRGLREEHCKLNDELRRCREAAEEEARKGDEAHRRAERLEAELELARGLGERARVLEEGLAEVRGALGEDCAEDATAEEMAEAVRRMKEELSKLEEELREAHRRSASPGVGSANSGTAPSDEGMEAVLAPARSSSDNEVVIAPTTSTDEGGTARNIDNPQDGPDELIERSKYNDLERSLTERIDGLREENAALEAAASEEAAALLAQVESLKSKLGRAEFSAREANMTAERAKAEAREAEVKAEEATAAAAAAALTDPRAGLDEMAEADLRQSLDEASAAQSVAERERDRLREELTRTSAAMAALEKDRDDLRNELDQVRSDLDDAQRHGARQMTSAAEEAEFKIGVLKEELSEREMRILELEGGIAAREERIETLEEMAKATATAEAEASTRSPRESESGAPPQAAAAASVEEEADNKGNDDEDNAVERLREQNAELVSVVQALREELSDLHDQIDERSAASDIRRRREEEFERLRSEHASRLNTLAEELDEAKHRAAELETERDVLARTLETTREAERAGTLDFAFLADARKASDDKERKQSARLSEMRRDVEVDALRKSLTETKTRSSVLERENAKLTSCIERRESAARSDVLSKLEERNARVLALEQTLAAQEEVAGHMRIEMDQLQGEMDRVSSQRRREVEEMESELMEGTAKVAAYEREVQALKMEMEERTLRHEAEVDRWRGRVEELEDESPMERNVRRMRDERAAEELHRKIDQLKWKLEEAREENEKLKKELREKEASLGAGGGKESASEKWRYAALAEEVATLKVRNRELEGELCGLRDAFKEQYPGSPRSIMDDIGTGVAAADAGIFRSRPLASHARNGSDDSPVSTAPTEKTGNCSSSSPAALAIGRALSADVQDMAPTWSIIDREGGTLPFALASKSFPPASPINGNENKKGGGTAKASKARASTPSRVRSIKSTLLTPPRLKSFVSRRKGHGGGNPPTGEEEEEEERKEPAVHCYDGIGTDQSLDGWSL